VAACQVQKVIQNCKLNTIMTTRLTKKSKSDEFQQGVIFPVNSQTLRNLSKISLLDKKHIVLLLYIKSISTYICS
jgi:hypothetical protein